MRYVYRDSIEWADYYEMLKSIVKTPLFKAAHSVQHASMSTKVSGRRL